MHNLERISFVFPFCPTSAKLNTKEEMAICEQGQNIRFFNIFNFFYLCFSLKGSAISDVEAQEHYDKFFEVCTHI